MEGNKIEDELYGNDVPLHSQESSIIEERKNNSHNAFVTSLNINSVQNKLLNGSFRAQIVIVSETKVDSSYQFRLERIPYVSRDRTKERGVLIAYCS